jgi:nicotinate-nucleotide adenylyltransferase
MLQAAIAPGDGILVDTREVDRAGTSFTMDTLSAVRGEIGDAPLLFVMGADAFGTLPRWHRWRELLDVAHLVVVSRPESAAREDPELEAVVDRAWCDDAQALLFAPGGRILFQPIPLLPISSTDIRARVRAGSSIRHLVPEPVRDIIISNRLYR